MPGMFLTHTHSADFVDDVEFTKDNQVLVRTGTNGTGTEFFNLDDKVKVAYAV